MISNLEEKLFKASDKYYGNDGSHDIGHIKRVLKNAKKIVEIGDYNVNIDVLISACILHDIIDLPKNHPDKKMSSRLAAKEAMNVLDEIDFPKNLKEEVKHAIEAHSFSANIETKTMEAKILQDADRFDALGAIGIARVFYVSGMLKRELFNSEDPMAKNRELDDKEYGLDHFEVKLLKLPKTMKTEAGRKIAEEKAEYIKSFREQLISEL